LKLELLEQLTFLTKAARNKGNTMSIESSQTEGNAVFQKRVQDLILDLAEAEARTHNKRFIDSPMRRRFFIGLESIVRRNKFLFEIAKRLRG
jgi:hypothetical protein